MASDEDIISLKNVCDQKLREVYEKQFKLSSDYKQLEKELMDNMIEYFVFRQGEMIVDEDEDWLIH